MAQRSARARSKLDKITAQSEAGPRSPTAFERNHSTKGIARLGSGGLLTPSASSVSGSSTRNSQIPAGKALPQQQQQQQYHQPHQRVGKGVLRTFFDAHGDKLRGRLVHANQRKDYDAGGGGGGRETSNNFYSGLSGGLGPGLSSLSTIGEERMQVKRWEGSGSRGELWDGSGKGKKDLELWFPDGDTLVYLTDKPSSSKNPQSLLYMPAVPQPSFRLRSSVLRQTESPYLLALLERSYRDDDSISVISSVDDNTSMDFDYAMQRTRTLEMSNSQTTFSSVDTTEIGIKFRLFLAAPARLDKLSRHRYHLTTRNFFAILFNQSLVGINLGQTLLDLSERIDKYLSSPSAMACELADRGLSEVESPYGAAMPGSSASEHKEEFPSHQKTQSMILNYLQKREFDDVRGWPEGAAGLLVWAEHAAKQNVTDTDEERIEGIWCEAFVHCTGQLSSLQLQPEWRDISPITKALIDRASLEIQVRVGNADGRIAGFNFHDMWPITSAHPPPARLAFDRFHKFLLKHYSSQFGSWPPSAESGRLTRTLYLLLQRDFTSLYSYIVDREAVWDDIDAEKRRIVKPNAPHFRADNDSLPITDILIGFDNRENHPPMPHPFPLVPSTASSKLGNLISISGGSFGQNKRQQSFFKATGSFPRNRSSSGATAQAALALSESTNIDALASTISNPLLEAFQAHERSIPSHEINPHDARKGRWIFIYGVLQTLATVAVDAPGVNWTEGVDYWLNPRLRGTPPWKCWSASQAGSENDPALDERSHFRSHCWVTARMPTAAAPGQITFPPPRTHIGGFANVFSRRSKSRGRRPSTKTTSIGMAVTTPELLEDYKRPKIKNSSGDEGDDEMDGDHRDAMEDDSPSPPPQEVLPKTIMKEMDQLGADGGMLVID